MADIDIERKPPPSIWPWIIGLAAIVAVIFVWAAMDDRDEPEQIVAEYAPGTAATTGTTAAAIDEYTRFADAEAGAADVPAMGREHEYTAEGIRKLAAALESLVEQRPTDDGRARLQRFQEIASRIQENPTSAQHADQVRTVFTRATDVIGSVDEAAANQLRSTAESIDTGEPLLEQRGEIREFFRRSADAIQAAARTNR